MEEATPADRAVGGGSVAGCVGVGDRVRLVDVAQGVGLDGRGAGAVEGGGDGARGSGVSRPQGHAVDVVPAAVDAADTARGGAMPYRLLADAQPTIVLPPPPLGSMERIWERTRSGLAAARRRGRVGGRPRVMADHPKVRAVGELVRVGHSVASAAQVVGVSVSTARRYTRLAVR